MRTKRASPSAVPANLSTNRRIRAAVGRGRPSTSLAVMRRHCAEYAFLPSISGGAVDRRRSAPPLRHALMGLLAAGGFITPAVAQRTGENAVTSADDAFGTSVGNETIGLYSTDEVRGFSPVAAGNIRIDGLYMGGIVIGNQRIQSGSTVRVGLSAQGYPFPAPTGIVELSLRPAGT